MKNPQPRTEFRSLCACHPGMTRRRFLAGCAACAGAAGLTGIPIRLRAASTADKTKIRIVYALHGPVQDVPDWPNKGFDFRPFMERTNSALAARFPDQAFIPTLATGPEQALKILDDDKTAGIDGYLVFQMNCWNSVAQTFAAAGRTVLYVDFQFGGGGGFLVYSAGFLRAGTPNLGFLGSSRFDDLAAAVACFTAAKAAGPGYDFNAAVGRIRRDRTLKPAGLSGRTDALATLSAQEAVRQMKASRILAVKGPDPGPETTVMGIPVDYIPFSELNDAWSKADKDEARAVADRWIRDASRIDGVSRAEIENSAAMYLGQKAVLKKRGANAISINCLGGFYGGHIHAYPCLGFHELNNEGLVGGCECDVPSAAAMVAGGILTHGRPGYISDPVLDSAKRQIIYAHCVASNKVLGPKGPSNPYEILTHSEDRQGASIRSILPSGYLTSSIQISNDRKEILFHQAEAVGNDPDDRACRTKLAAEPVGDFERLYSMWDLWGWHRVTFYGDLKKPVQDLAGTLGWKVVEET